MAAKSSVIKQSEVKRIFKAAIDAGYEAARVIFHPDGRIEASASFSESDGNPENKNSWDEAIK